MGSRQHPHLNTRCCCAHSTHTHTPAIQASKGRAGAASRGPGAGAESRGMAAYAALRRNLPPSRAALLQDPGGLGPERSSAPEHQGVLFGGDEGEGSGELYGSAYGTGPGSGGGGGGSRLRTATSGSGGAALAGPRRSLDQGPGSPGPLTGSSPGLVRSGSSLRQRTRSTTGGAAGGRLAGGNGLEFEASDALHDWEDRPSAGSRADALLAALPGGRGVAWRVAGGDLASATSSPRVSLNGSEAILTQVGGVRVPCGGEKEGRGWGLGMQAQGGPWPCLWLRLWGARLLTWGG